MIRVTSQRKSLDTSFLVFLQKSPWNMMLFGTSVVSGSLLLWPLINRASAGGSAQVGALEAVQLINRRDAVVLDVRESSEFAAGHIPNARNIPFKELENRLRELEKMKSRPIIVSAQPGPRAAKVCGALKKIGFTDVVALRGGLNAWVEASLPIQK
jgi:rhodanese-related sulfurtransferase